MRESHSFLLGGRNFLSGPAVHHSSGLNAGFNGGGYWHRYCKAMVGRNIRIAFYGNEKTDQHTQGSKMENPMKSQVRLCAIYAALLLLSLNLMTAPAFADDPASANREALQRSLIGLAERAQRYFHTAISEGGGGGSFANVFLFELTSSPVNAYGSFVLFSPSAVSMALAGYGIEIGNDGSTPVLVTVVVYADSMDLVINN